MVGNWNKVVGNWNKVVGNWNRVVERPVLVDGYTTSAVVAISASASIPASVESRRLWRLRCLQSQC